MIGVIKNKNTIGTSESLQRPTHLKKKEMICKETK